MKEEHWLITLRIDGNGVIYDLPIDMHPADWMIKYSKEKDAAGDPNTYQDRILIFAIPISKDQFKQLVAAL